MAPKPNGHAFDLWENYFDALSALGFLPFVAIEPGSKRGYFRVVASVELYGDAKQRVLVCSGEPARASAPGSVEAAGLRALLRVLSYVEGISHEDLMAWRDWHQGPKQV